jgi:hypothetical protein
MNTIDEVKTTREDATKTKKLMLKDGWRSVQYWIRHKNIEADDLRKLAKRGIIFAKQLNTDGIVTWYYREADVKSAITYQIAGK